jgi:hypothetical protein
MKAILLFDCPNNGAARTDKFMDTVPHFVPAKVASWTAFVAPTQYAKSVIPVLNSCRKLRMVSQIS